MNTISGFRKCKLSNNDLLQKVDTLTDEMFKTLAVPTRHIPARPDSDYDLLIGELIQRFADKWIPVGLELPEIGEYVLVYNTEGAILVARLFNDGWVALFADGEKPMGELTAEYWMPLPAEPLKIKKADCTDFVKSDCQ
jgi:hypothetical protein